MSCLNDAGRVSNKRKVKVKEGIIRDGESERVKRCAKEHVQCREEGEASGHDPTVIQGHHQVPYRHAKARCDFYPLISFFTLFYSI